MQRKVLLASVGVVIELERAGSRVHQEAVVSNLGQGFRQELMFPKRLTVLHELPEFLATLKRLEIIEQFSIRDGLGQFEYARPVVQEALFGLDRRYGIAHAPRSSVFQAAEMPLKALIDDLLLLGMLDGNIRTSPTGNEESGDNEQNPLLGHRFRVTN